MTRKIIEQLKKYDNEYYNGINTITDTEYDLLKETAKKQFPNDPYFKTIGAKVTNNKVSLPFVLGSLDKVKTDTVEKRIKDFKGVVASLKLDGVSFMVTYNKGRVVFAATRGDGQEGQNITDKMIRLLPVIDRKDEISLRGELLLFGDKYKELGYKNRRNGVNGALVDHVDYLTPVFYEVLDCPGIERMTEYDRLGLIDELGLDVVKHTLHDVNDVTADMLTEMLMKEKAEAMYDIDGLVLTDNHSEREDVMFPENKVAFKVNTEAVKTKVRKVEWVLGRTGKVTPIVHVEPIEVDGVTISKATGFNYEFINENGIGEDAVVGIIRANQVIPYITEVFEQVEVEIPAVCPSCNNELKIEGVDLVCDNDECYDSKVRQIAHFFKTLGSEYVTETTVRNLGVSSIEEIYELDELEISQIEGFGIKKAEQVYYEIQKTLKTTPDKLLAAFGISGIGVTLSPMIINKYGFDELFTINDITDVEGIGEIISDNLVNNINNYKELYDFMKEKGLVFNMKKKTNISGLIFTLTGKMPMKRNIITNMIVNKGGMVKGIGKCTDYLVTDDPNSGSIKNRKAQEMGVKVINFDELMDMLEE